MDRVAQSVRAAAWGGLRSQSAVVRFPAVIERFFGVIVVANGPLTNKIPESKNKIIRYYSNFEIVYLSHFYLSETVM